MKKKQLHFLTTLLLAISYFNYAQEEFILSCHRDPHIVPISERAALDNIEKVKNAYFNLMSGVNDKHLHTIESNTTRFQRLASVQGIKTLIMDDCYKKNTQGMQPFNFNEYVNSSCKENIISTYKNLSTSERNALWGYFFGDEPYPIKNNEDENKTLNIKYWIRHFNNGDPQKNTMINLHPFYFFDSKDYDDKSIAEKKKLYSDYIDNYIFDTNVRNSAVTHICFDNYPFRIDLESKANIFMKSYFYNLRIIADKTDGKKDFWAMPMFVKERGWQEVNLEKFRFMTFAPIAYGAKGLKYFYYQGGIEVDDIKYSIVKKHNKYIKNILGPIVMSSSLVGVYHQNNTNLNTGGFEFKNRNLVKSSPHIENISNENAFIGLFKHEDGFYYGIVVNKSITPQNVSVTLTGDHSNILKLSQRVDNYNSTIPNFNNVTTTYNENLGSSTFNIGTLEGGEAVAFKTKFTVFNDLKKADFCVKEKFKGNLNINYSGGHNWLHTIFDFKSGNGAYGGPDHQPAPADYDGDGYTDISMKLDNGQWKINYSSTGFETGWEFISEPIYGGAESHPVPADYDGDGMVDFSIKKDDGQWIIYYADQLKPDFISSIGAYGNHTVHPVPADYDGDGMTDLSVKTDSGVWYINYASSSPTRIHPKGGFYTGWNFKSDPIYGGAESHPVPADYDGDKKADLSVKKNNGQWIVNYSKPSIPDFISGIGAYGGESAHPVPADYDGDGKADLSIKTNAGVWYINYSSTPKSNSVHKGGFYSGWNFISDPIYGDANSIVIPGNYDYMHETNNSIIEKKLDTKNNTENIEFKATIVPNPTFNNANINFSLKKDSNISIKLYDISGKIVYELRDEKYKKGNHSLKVDLSKFNSGFYLCNIKSNTYNKTLKLIKK